LAERLQDAGHRVVCVGTPPTNNAIEVPIVFGDQEQGGYLAVKHLLDLGHRRIAFQFLGDYPTLRRWAGCQHAIEEAKANGIGLQTEVLDVIESGDCFGQIGPWCKDDQAVQEYFASPTAPTAIVSWNDDFAVKLLTRLQSAGIRVPTDVSLIGYDNLARSAAVHPALTTIDGAFDQQIRAALRLLSQPEAPVRNQSIIVLPTLINRESTALPRGA
jgi:LacI family transcriptional regulator